MVNSKAKGSRAELEYKAILESRGYVVERTRSGGRFGQKDFFNLFDLFALRKDGGLLVQVKCNRTQGCKPMIEKFVNHPENIKKILAIRYDREGWKEMVIQDKEGDDE